MGKILTDLDEQRSQDSISMTNISFHFLSKHLQIPHHVLDTVWAAVVQRYRDTIPVVRGELLTPA